MLSEELLVKPRDLCICELTKSQCLQSQMKSFDGVSFIETIINFFKKTPTLRKNLQREPC